MKTLLKVLRESHGYDVAFLADRLGMSVTDYQELELGKGALGDEQAKALGELYGTAAEQFRACDKVVSYNSDNGRAITNVNHYYEMKFEIKLESL
jgi:transcriptional regulator with XRE-family HTH domain